LNASTLQNTSTPSLPDCGRKVLRGSTCVPISRLLWYRICPSPQLQPTIDPADSLTESTTAVHIIGGSGALSNSELVSMPLTSPPQTAGLQWKSRPALSAKIHPAGWQQVHPTYLIICMTVEKETGERGKQTKTRRKMITGGRRSALLT
jgi:hypothetical protein